MLLADSADTRVILPEGNRQAIVTHCLQVLAAFAKTGAGECRAFGLIAGAVSGHVVTVARCLPLHCNVRSRPPYKEYVDRVMAEHAVPSQTPLSQRGWVAAPDELLERVKEIRRQGHTLLGTYHMHRVGWAHDPLRDTPTRVDTVLARESRLLMFIVSMVEPDRPLIRAFYEGIKEREIPIIRLERETH